MKKLGAILIGLLLLSAFYACEKSNLGEYNPKAKIEKVYDESDGRYLLEQWQWDGDMLKSIDYFRKSGNLDYSQNYLYDGKRLSRIEWANNIRNFYMMATN